jgi:hypothetical protein
MHLPHIEHCNVCKQYVRLDQTQQDCAREHRCQSVNCPMQQYFHFAPEPKAGSTGPAQPTVRRK